MLYDPKWNKQPSLEGFIAWLETKGKTEIYYWGKTENCACAQYAATLGLDGAYGRIKGEIFNPNEEFFSILNRLALNADVVKIKSDFKFAARSFSSLLKLARDELTKVRAAA